MPDSPTLDLQEQIANWLRVLPSERDPGEGTFLLIEALIELRRLRNALREIRGGAKACVAEGQGSICRGQRRAEDIAKTVLPKTAYERVLETHSESQEFLKKLSDEGNLRPLTEKDVQAQRFSSEPVRDFSAVSPPITPVEPPERPRVDSPTLETRAQNWLEEVKFLQMSPVVERAESLLAECLHELKRLAESIDAIDDWADSGKYEYPGIEHPLESTGGARGDRMQGYNLARHHVAGLLPKPERQSS